MGRLSLTFALSPRRRVTMEDFGENTTVLSTLRSLNNFISQRVEGASGLDVSMSASGSLQKHYEQSMQVSSPLGLWEYTWPGWGQVSLEAR